MPRHPIKNPTIQAKSDRRICLGIFVIAIIFCLPMLLSETPPRRDTAWFYVSLTRAFIHSNWDGAFFPLIPPLVPVTGGIIGKLLQCEAFMALKLASILFFSATVFPLFSLLRNLFDRRIATVGSILYISTPMLLTYAGGGFLESGKMLFMIWGVQIILSGQDNFKQPLFLGASLAGLSLCRTEGVFIALFLGASYMGIQLWNSKTTHQRNVSLCKTTLTVLTFLILTAPWILYEKKMTGYPVLDSRQVGILQKLTPPNLAEKMNESAEMPADTLQNLTPPPRKKLEVWNDLLEPFVDGIFPTYYGPLTLLGFALFYRKKSIRTQHLFLPALVIIHSLVVWAGFQFKWANARYMCQAMPLLLGWTALPLLSLFDHLKTNHRKIMCTAGAMILLYMAVRGNKYAWKAHENPFSDITASAESIAQSNDWTESPFFPLKSTTISYHNGRAPIVVEVSGNVTTAAGGDLVRPDQYLPSFNQESLIQLCELKNVHLIIDDEAFRQYCPDIQRIVEQSSQLTYAYEAPGHTIRIIRVNMP